MQQINQSFLARQLLLTEMHGELVTASPDLGCLCCISGGELWVGVHHLEAIQNGEQFVQGVQSLAQANNVPLGGFIALLLPEEESQTQVQQFAEVLYVYGYPQLSGIGRGGPDTVQVLTKAPASSGKFAIGATTLDDPGAAELAEQAGEADDRLDSPAWEDEEAMLNHTRFFIARQQGQAAGLAGITQGELAARVSVYWVAPEFRGAGVGRELIAHLSRYWTEQGKLVLSTWTHREGHLRYYFNKLGFEDRLRACYYFREDLR